MQRLNVVQEQQSDLATFEEGRSSTLGSVAGQINANNRDLEQLQSEHVRLQEELSYEHNLAQLIGKIFDLRRLRLLCFLQIRSAMKLVRKVALLQM